MTGIGTLDGLGVGNCLMCRHILEGDDRLYCPIYGEWVLSPSVAGMDCPSYEEVT